MAHKILVVDDEANALNLAVAVLKREGYDVVTAVDGEDALNYLVGLFVEQNGKCTLTGLPLTFGQGGNASLDKIDAKGYYRKGNVHWTDKTINQMKRGYSVETFRQYAKLIK